MYENVYHTRIRKHNISITQQGFVYFVQVSIQLITR